MTQGAAACAAATRAARRPVAALAVLALCAWPCPVAAQPAAARHDAVPTVSLLGAVAVTSPLLTDGNGTRVRLALAPVVGARLRFAGRGSLEPAVTARLGRAGVRLRAGEARWSAGRVLQADLLAGAGWRLHPLVTARAAIGVTWLRGPHDVAPFDASRHPRPTVQAGVSLRRRERARTALEVDAQAFRLAPDPGRAGGVLRVLVGLSRVL
ncbi:MAG TPA: hypothetical protein VFS08_13915 [Gemmatimonadaceae bacterium]|nr:hypothetical protein [Gemmatimonadaceae bacterium]